MTDEPTVQDIADLGDLITDAIPTQCTRCDGHGEITVAYGQDAFSGLWDTDEVTCPRCHGSAADPGGPDEDDDGWD